ncbi:MAG: hypothetical protein H6721_25295 [Sandaracinus sp.]|nr:hypothetical protein [Sandaracinus sp.]MCB9617953.1 hypothetical protein [Sandaracinus sp.]MCB9635449.1 hypothetical protein [Sandaracinus sp.]
MTTTDWGAWSREAKAEMQRRNDAWTQRWALSGVPYEWSLDDAQIVFRRPDDEVVARLVWLGSHSRSEGTFLWSWANRPVAAAAGVEAVRAFGEAHELGMLCEAEWPAAEAESLEAGIVAARVLDAEGLFVAAAGELTLYFALFDFRPRRAG